MTGAGGLCVARPLSCVSRFVAATRPERDALNRKLAAGLCHGVLDFVACRKTGFIIWGTVAGLFHVRSAGDEGLLRP
jgi:hypothetical protein